MDIKNRLFFIVFGLVLVGSIGYAYYHFVIAKDYLIENQEDCDPMTERCFVWHCDPDATDESEKCTGDPDTDTWYYKLSFRKASKVPLCDPKKDEDCQPMACEEGEKDCYDVFCSDEAKTKYEQEADCSDPEEYAKEHPDEDEDADSSDEEECAPDDQECLKAQDSDAAGDEDSSEADVDVSGNSESSEADSSGDAYETCQPGTDAECLDDDQAASKAAAENPETGSESDDSASE